MAGDAAPLLNLAEIDGRGRALMAARSLRGGQIVLRDSPILLYSALPFTKQPPPSSSSSSSSAACYCDHCFRILPPSSSPPAVPCPSCARHAFCGPGCLSAAAATSHTPWVCQALSRLAACPLLDSQPVERHVQARFLIAACNLAAVSPSDFQLLLSLQGREAHADDTVAAARFLHSLLSSDKLNAFGLMEPVSSRDGGEVDGERSVRAYGIYPRASFSNHDCLPNACRFDYVDAASDGNTDIIVRMIHDVPQGREICLSYFPVNLNYVNRQRRLMEDYGFTCDCDRCKVEANWSDDENEHDDIGEDNDGDGKGWMRTPMNK
ncbi:hypothetical protein BT93_J1021 [Corymbia citriodora subsp. variegata]|nr:hypothetical protein BT93_J1021 [Corymbia citriodora subsp. variegata]